MDQTAKQSDIEFWALLIMVVVSNQFWFSLACSCMAGWTLLQIWRADKVSQNIKENPSC